MPDLIAQGQTPEHRWRRQLPVDQICVLGRETGFWSVPWDRHISRRHAEICFRDGCLSVSRQTQAANPIFLRGRQVDRFTIVPGEHFVIGGTSFTLVDERVRISFRASRPATEQTFSAEYLKGLRFRDADRRIEILSRIPEIISGAVSDEEMLVRLTNLVLTGIPEAVAVAIVAGSPEDAARPLNILHWDCRGISSPDFEPSAALIRQATETHRSVVHLWTAAAGAGGDRDRLGCDWAFCTPLGGAACRGWAIYAVGRFSEAIAEGAETPPDSLQDHLKFAELVASTMSRMREARLLEHNQASLRQFFSPVVLDALAGQDADEVLAPRESQVSVLFCDLRGFSLHSEQSAEDLRGLLQRVSDALGVTTRQILAEGGVVGDFHGDAAMGFWGWPFDQPDAVLRACRAALAIRGEFASAARQSQHPMAGFRIGIGIASGRAVAGKIGTVDQVKVTVFGPVVNLASRLEGMTKTLRAPILLDASSAAAARRDLASGVGRLRRVAVVQPYGISQHGEVCELLPPADQDPQLDDAAIARYESALDAVQAGEWGQADRLLRGAAANDAVAGFLADYIAHHGGTPPSDWDGVIRLESK